MSDRSPAPGLVPGEDGRARCWWQGGLEDYCRYHDDEWGRPQGEDHRLFEKLCLEGFQSGLSWLTILRKRARFREVFHGFDPERVARMDVRDVERLLDDPGIVRHRGKIEAAIANAVRVRALMQEEGCSLASYLWRHEPPEEERPARLDHATLSALATTPASTRLSTDLRARGWRFVGPTTAYAFMQAVGMVNDHLDGCCVREEVDAERRAFARPG